LHTLLKHGRQLKSLTVSIAFFSSVISGGVKSGLVEPYIPIRGISNAAATCNNPESLLTTILACDIKATVSGSSNWPAKL